MKLKLMALVILFITNATLAQKEPNYSIDLDSNINDIYLHQLTGTAIATTNKAVYGINGVTGEKIWVFDDAKSLFNGVANLNLAGIGIGKKEESLFSEISSSPFGRFNQTIFNIKTGKKIIDAQTNNFKKIMTYKYIYGKKAILFVTKSEKTEAKLFLVSIENDTVLWETKITSNKKLESEIFGGGISNFEQNENLISFSTGKTIFLIHKNDGNIILSKKYDAGKLFFSEDKKNLIAVKNKGGSLIGSALKAGLTAGLSLLGKKPIGKELIAFDVNTGKESWKKSIKLDEGFVNYQFEDDKLFLIHKDGARLYDYHTGKEAWKKEFGKKKVKAIEKTSEGYLVYYKNKKHLVDTNGKKVWKKPQKVIKNVDFKVDDEEEFTTFKYNNGTIFVTPYRIEYFENNNKKRVYKISLDEEDDKLTYDQKNNNVILLKNKKLYILNPDRNQGKEQVKKIDFKEYKKITGLEVRDKGYFINSNWEYVLIDFDGNIIRKEFFKQPGEGLRHLKNIGAALAGAAATEVTVTQKKPLDSSTEFVNRRNTETTTSQKFHLTKHHKEFEALSNELYTPKRYSAFKATKNNVFFYTKKEDKKVLLQIDKDSGKIIETYEFGINKPKYIIDNIEKRILFRKGKELKIFSYQ